MSATIRVLVCAEPAEGGEQVVASLRAEGFDVQIAAEMGDVSAYDCLVGVPSGETAGGCETDVSLASKLGGEQPPAVLYTDASTDAREVLTAGVDDIVRRTAAGSQATLAARIRQQATASERALADGGAETGITYEEFPFERLHEIASDRDLSRLEKIDKLLAAGAEQLGTSDAFLTRIEDGTQHIVRSVGEHSDLDPGETAPLSDSYCQYTLEEGGTLAVRDAEESDVIEDRPFERFGLGCYLGTTIRVDGERYGTVCFADTEPRDDEFTPRQRTFVEMLTDWISYLLEQRLYEQELEQQRAFTESLMDSLPDPLYATDESGQLLRWNSRFEELLGNGEIEGTHAADFVAEEDRKQFSDVISRALDGEQTSIEASVETGEDESTPFEFSSGPLRDETDSITGVAGVGHDVTEQHAYRERLSGILDTTRSLMQARDRNHVAEIAVNAAKELLGFDISVFRLYNSGEQTLEPTAVSEETRELVGERPVYDVGEGFAGDVFATGDPRVIDDVRETETDLDLGPVRSAMYYPVGVHGTISVCSTEPNAFDEVDEQMLALLATSAAAACMRAKREQDVREAQKHTEHVLDRVNGLVQNTVEVLVQATTREELEEGVVNELATAGPYSFAWIGQPDVASETLSPSAWAGTVSVPIHGRSFELSRPDEPVSLAYREQKPQVLQDIETEGYGLWAEIAAESEVESLITIPLVYKDANYGVLSVFADESEALDERERVVLESLGRVIANAINAIERGRILDATEIIELEFSINEQDLLFSRLSSRANCILESAGTDYMSDGRVRLYLIASGVDAEEIVSVAEDDAGVEAVTLIVDHEEECLLELTVEESLLATLTEYGAVPREVTADNGQARFIVELPYEAEARELFELVEQQYSSTELLGYHERERPVETRQEFKAALSERFTDRQETALRTAYLGGFFDWPRDIDGNELAEAMDISRPTYHQHLRSAQRKVFEELFE